MCEWRKAAVAVGGLGKLYWQPAMGGGVNEVVEAYQAHGEADAFAGSACMQGNPTEVDKEVEVQQAWVGDAIAILACLAIRRSSTHGWNVGWVLNDLCRMDALCWNARPTRGAG